MANEMIRKIATVQGAFFTYNVAYFNNPGVYAIGTMDLNDPDARDGGESKCVFYFTITPEEYAWYESDREKLSDLAQLLQIRMPKSRFLALVNRGEMSQEEKDALVKHSLGDEKLDNDEAFEAFAAKMRENNARRNAAARETMRVAATSGEAFAQARHALALHQLTVRNMDQTIRNLQADLQKKDADSKEAADIRTLLANAQTRRMEEGNKGQALEEALGNRIFTAPAIFIAVDACWKPGLPLMNAATGVVCIFSSQEIADRYQKAVAADHKIFCQISKIEHAKVKNLLRTMEMMGVRTLLVDDGTEPVQILLKNIIPALDRGYIEGHNAGIRGQLIRNLQVAAALRLYGSEMEEEWRLTQNDNRATLDRSFLQELGNTVLFMPSNIPEKQARPLAGNYIYTEAANTAIHSLCAKDKLTQPSMNRAGFTGRHIVLPGKVSLPLRAVTLKNGEEQKQMLVAFTSREEAMAFSASNKQTAGDTIIAFSLEEVATIAKNADGILLDPPTIGLPLTNENLDAALKVRNERKLIYNHNYKAPENQ